MLLVTGHKGFIGKHLTKELDSRGIKWIGYDLVDGNDIRDKQKLDEFFERNQITRVIHLAALAGVRRGEKYPEEYIKTNIIGTQNLIDISSDHGVSKFIFYSSSSVYGQGNPPIKEDDVKNPLSLYGITKLAGEKIVRNTWFPTVIIRPFTVYGEEGRKDEVVFKWIERIKNGLHCDIYGDGNSCRGYVYVKDLVKYTVDILEKQFEYEQGHNGIDFNLGGSEVIRLNDIIKEFKKFYGDKFVPVYMERSNADVFQQYADTSFAHQTIGFDPKPNFIKNLRNILKKYGKG